MGFMEAHIAWAGHCTPHNHLQRVRQAPFLQFLLLRSLCIYIQAQPYKGIAE